MADALPEFDRLRTQAAPPPPAWPAGPPAPLPPSSEPVPALPESLVPGPLRPWLCDIAERVQIPLEFVVIPALVALGIVIGRSFGIRPKRQDDWTVTAHSWGAIVGPPGVMKTPALAAATAPLGFLAGRARREHEAALAAHMAAQAAESAQRDAIKDAMKKAAKAGNREALETEQKRLAELVCSAPAKERRYTTSDGTIEKIGELLSENPRGIGIVRDELTGFLKGLERDDRLQDQAFYLEGWNGLGGFDVDRIGRGKVRVEALCLSILGGIQPARLEPYVKGTVDQRQADGLLPRFQLLVWPDSFGEWRYVDRWPNREARQNAYSVYEALDSVAPEDIGCESGFEGEIPFLRLAPDAQDIFAPWLTRLEGRLRAPEAAETPAFTQHLAKYRSLMPKLALVFDAMARVSGTHPGGGVTARSALMAAAWCDYLEAHARKVYSCELARATTAAHDIATRIKRGDIFDGMSPREIYRNEWEGLASRGVVMAGLQRLEALGWVRLTSSDENGGRPKSVIRLHPILAREQEAA
ncbi:MAG: hypothetical protein DIJKHBIC_04160 [Thermoanaerobaculia bacterium]|nr:hypothetical protein [Thermoanaerobaculia bacterium]